MFPEFQSLSFWWGLVTVNLLVYAQTLIQILRLLALFKKFLRLLLIPLPTAPETSNVAIAHFLSHLN